MALHPDLREEQKQQQIFENEWQSFCTKKNRSLELASTAPKMDEFLEGTILNPAM